ncbi:MAG: plastocyanin/azurin family copper-binding protein [Verrucomicrobiota bacterium]
MNRFRTLVLLAAVVAGVLALSAPSQAALPKLTGTVGPGFTIKLTRLGKKVAAVKAGTYSITVSDKSNIHNYHLVGPGVNKEITSIGFVGTKTVIVKLKKGTYKFVCDPHASIMTGKFKVL